MTAPFTVLLVSFHFAPSNEIGGRRPTALAHFLLTKGFRVVVVSAFAEASDCIPGDSPNLVRVKVRRPRKWLIDAVVKYKKRSSRSRDVSDIGATTGRSSPEDVRTGVSARLRQAFFRLVYLVDEHKRWAWRASKAAVRAGRIFDARVVISTSPPNSVLLAGDRAARKLRVPHIADLRDPWIDGLSGDDRFSLTIQRHLERRVVTRAAAVTATSSTVAHLMSRRFPALRNKFQTVRNGYDTNPKDPASETGHRLAILFAGELYVGRNPFPFLSALEALLARSETDATRISVSFMGRASSYDGQSLQDWMRGKRCARVVKIAGHLPQEAVAKAVEDSTLLLNLSQQQRLSIPAKTFEHLTSAREILLLCESDCETAQLVEGIAGVIQVDPTDTLRLESALSDIYQRHVVEGTMTTPAREEVAKFSREAANQQMFAVIEGVVNNNSKS